MYSNTQQKAANGTEELIHELNYLTPIRVDSEHVEEEKRNEHLSIQLTEPTTEAFAAEHDGNWTTVNRGDQKQTGNSPFTGE